VESNDEVASAAVGTGVVRTVRTVSLVDDEGTRVVVVAVVVAVVAEVSREGVVDSPEHALFSPRVISTATPERPSIVPERRTLTQHFPRLSRRSRRRAISSASRGGPIAFTPRHPKHAAHNHGEQHGRHIARRRAARCAVPPKERREATNGRSSHALGVSKKFLGEKRELTKNDKTSRHVSA